MKPVFHIQPAEGWGYFTENKARLSEELVEIATNEVTNTSVYMTEEDGLPYLYVYRDDKKIFQSKCATAYETERNLRVVYAQYISDLRVVGGNDSDDVDDTDEVIESTVVVSDDEDDDMPPCSDLDAMSDNDFQIMVSEREDAILLAVSDLIEVLTEDDASVLEFDPSDDDGIDKIIDHIVEYLAVECGFRIRRPMEIIDEDTGLIVRTEYPYEEFEFGNKESQ